MTVRIIIILLFLIPVFASARELSYSFSPTIVDETGAPVAGAEVRHMFYAKAESSSDLLKIETTNANGRCKFNGMAYDLGVMEVRKEGFYPSRIGLGEYFNAISSNGVQKWDNDVDITVLTRRKINPIPMHAKVEFVKLPKDMHLKTVAYDLVAGDFVHPHGNGKISDFIFSYEVYGNNVRELKWNLVIRFRNHQDGIIAYSPPVVSNATGSHVGELRSPHEAPSSGYVSTKDWRNTEREGSEKVYIFRVRSEVNEAGEVIYALYGKMYGAPRLIRNFELIGNKITPISDSLNFLYYLNPNGDRNIEFEPGRNLFKDLPIERRVLNP